MAEKTLDDDWCNDCEQYFWNCDCDEHEALNDVEITDIEFINPWENYDGDEESVE